MPLFRWITRLMSVSVQETPRLDPHVQLSITRLEERRVLNADASLVGSQMPLADCSPVTEELELPTSLCNSGGGPITASVASTIDHDTPQWLFELAIANAAQNQEVVVTTVEDSAELNAFLTMVQALPAQDAPVTIVAGLAEGTYSGLNLSLPSNVTLVLDGQGGGVTIVGGSPALEVTSGQVIVQDGVTFSVSSDDPTIVVQAGGWLTLTDTIVHESDGFDQSAILVHAGGELDLSSGDNTLNVRGAGQLMTWQDSASLDIVGNTLQLNGNLLDTSERADNFEIEDRITHALDNGTFGRVTWVPDSVYVTTSTLGIQRGIDVADAGDTVHIAAGTYVHTGQIDVDKSVTIIGAGQDETIIRRSGQATGTELRTVQVNAPDVTFQSLQFAGWTDVPSNANVGNGYLVWLDTPADHTTFDDVRFDGNDIRVAIYVGTRNDLTVTNSRFTGTYFRAAIRGAGERMLISHNRFEESHYWYSPIYMEYGAPTSGEISFNYFAHRVGVNNQVYGDFKSDGTGLWAITNWQPNATTSDGLYIVHNTFHFQDSDLVNQLGNQPIPEAIHIDPLLPASGPIVIRDNIFQGYKYTGPQAGTEPLWQPAGGVFEGALSFDGFDDYGWFVDPDLNIGANGGLSLWVNLNELGRQQTLVHGAMEVQIDASNRIYFYTNKADGSTATLVRTQPLTSILQTGQWVHVGITWDLSTKTGRIYVNGVEAPTGYTHGPVRSGWNNPNPTAGITFFVGDDPTTPGRNLNGKVDDLAFFDATLTAGQMAALANAGGNGALDGPAGNLVLHWTLDQSSGAVAADAVKGLPLTIVPDGTPLGAQDTAEWRDGLGIDFGSGPGGALEFDGLTNYATFSDPDFDIGTNGSLALWVKLDQVGRQQTLIHGALEVQIDASNRIYFYTNKADGANATLVRSQPQTLVAGQWVHIALTWDLAAKTGRIYVNGAEVSYLNGPVRTGWNNPNPTAGQQFIVGNDLTAPQKGTDRRFLNGLMDDVAFFDKTLTLAEIQSIHANGVAPDVNLAAHWSFDTAPSDDVFAGDSGTDIPLNLYRVPPPPHIQGFAINAPAGTVVSNNVFFDNDVDFNPLVNDLGNNIFADPVLNLGTIPDEDPYQIAFGSVAAWASTEYQADCFTDTPHIGAYQGNPGLFAHGDLVVNGSCGDDLLIIDATDPDNVTISFTWDLGGLHETILTPIPWTNPTGVIFNGKLGDDRFIIINPPDGVFTLDNEIFFHGGTGGEGSPQGNPEGDRLEIVGGTATTVDHDLTNATDGFVHFNGTLAISYTELEQILDTIEAEDRQFALPDSENPDVTLQDHADGGQMELSGSTFVDVVFANPSVTLTIDGGVMDDQIAVDSVDPAFRASLIIDGQAGDDTIALGANLLLGSATSAGNLTLTAEAIDVSASSIDTASGANAGSVIFNGPLTVSDNLSINTDHATGTDGDVDFNGTVNSSAGDGHGLIVTAGAGNATFTEAVGAGAGGALGAVLVNSSGVTRFNSTVAAASLTTDAGGSTELNGNVSTSGAQTYNDAVVLDSPVSLQTTNSAVLFGSTVDSAANEANSLTLTAGAGNATFTGAVGAGTDGALGAVLVNSSGVTRFNSTVAAANLTTDAGGSTELNGNVTTIGEQTYNDAVVLDSPVTLQTTDSAVLFGSTVDSAANEANSLTVTAGAGNVTFTGAVGAGTDGALGAVLVNSSGVTRFNSTVAAASLTTNAGGSTELNGNVTTIGEQAYNDAVVLDNPVTLQTTDGAVLFGSTVDSAANEANSLTVTAGAGNVTFTEAVGAGTGGALGAVLVNSSGVTRFASTVAAAGLTTDAGGSTELNGNVTTTGAQTYNDAVRIDSPVTLQTTDSAVLFGSTVDSAASEANSLTLTAGAGNATFTEAVGAAIDGALGAITINSAADVTFSSTLETTGNVTQVAGSGTTTFSGTSGTGIGGNLSVTTNAIALNSATITTVGTVDLAAQNAISIHSGAGLDAGASTIAIAANQDGTGTQGFTQADGTVIQTTNDSEDAIHIAVGGGGGAAIAALQTGDDGRVTIVAGGPISDTNGDAMNITAGSASLTAAGGIGSSDALETAIDVLAFRNLGAGDVQITNTGDLAIGTLGTLSGGSAGTGSITLKTDSDIDICNDVRTGGGALENDEGLIVIDAGGLINLQDGVVVQTGTGQVKGLPTENEANETVPTPPPPIAVVVVPVDQGGSNVNSAGIGYIDVTVNDPGVVNYQIEVDWGDGTVLTYRPEGTFSGGNDFVSEDTYRLSYIYQPDNLPDPENPAAPIPVKVTIRYDGRNVEDSAGGFVRGIVFREGGGELSTTVETELTVPGTGLFGFVKVTESVIVPVELRPTTPVVYVLTDVAPTIRQEEMYALQAAAAEQASIGAMRIFFRRVDAAGKEGPDVELPLDAFDRGLDTLFRKFPNGHYRVYLQEANSQRIRLIREIHVYQGRIVPADFRDDVMERQPGSDSGESPNGAAAESQAEPAGAEQPVGPAADDPPADPAGGVQQDAGAAGAAALAAWSARRRIDRLDRALEQAGRTGTKFGRRRRRMSSDQQN